MKEHIVVDPINDSIPDPVDRITGRVRYYFRNGHAFYWSSFFILIFIEFFLGGMLSKMLTKENYFIYINAINNMPFYNILVNIGLSYGLVYIIPQNTQLKYTLFRQTIRLQSAWYVIVVLAHCVLFFSFPTFFPQSLFIAAVISYTSVSRLNIAALFVATRAYNKAAIANLLQKTALLIAFLLIWDVEWVRHVFNERFLFLYPITELSVIVLYLVVFRRTVAASFGAPKINFRKRLLKYSRYAMYSNGLNVLYFTIMVFIIRSSALALQLKIIFGLCIMFFRYTGVTIAPIFSIMNPGITSVKGDIARVIKMYKKYLVAVVAMSLIVLVLCRFFLGFIVTHLYAPSYHSLPGYFYFFCYMIPLLFINSLNSSLLGALGRIKYTFRVEVLCTVILLVFFVYNLLSPIAAYYIFYYIVLAHLLVKFFMLCYGTYTALKE